MQFTEPGIVQAYQDQRVGEALQRVNNCMGICHWNTTYFDPNYPDITELAELYSAATGWETTVEDLKRMTMKQVALEKALNLRFTSFGRKAVTSVALSGS